VRSCWRIESNSSIQHTPPSESTSAPASRTHSPPASLCAVFGMHATLRVNHLRACARAGTVADEPAHCISEYLQRYVNTYPCPCMEACIYTHTPQEQHERRARPVTVRPALVVPMPVVSTARWLIFAQYLRSCDLPRPGSPMIRQCDSPPAHVCVCVCARVRVCVCVCVCVRACVRLGYMCICMYVCMYIYVYIYICIYICIYINIHIYIHTQKHVYVYTCIHGTR